MDTAAHLPGLSSDKMAILDDYTPSQLSYAKPVRPGVNGIYKNNPNFRVAPPTSKSRIGPTSNLNHSIDGIYKSPAKGDYDNIMGNNYSKQSMSRGSVTQSRKNLMNQSYDMPLNLKLQRNMFNPITGGFP